VLRLELILTIKGGFFATMHCFLWHSIEIFSGDNFLIVINSLMRKHVC